MRNRRFVMVAVILGSGALCSIMLSSVRSVQPAPQAGERDEAKRVAGGPGVARTAAVQPAVPAAVREDHAPRAPDAHSPVEPEEVLETMSRDELTTAIADIDQELERTNAVARLNAEEVDDEERIALGFQLERIALLKHQLAKLQLEALEQAVAEYEGEHAARVAQYLGKNK